MQLNDKVQHVYLVGAKSLGAYGGYETFVYKLTEYHQNKENIKYHVACKANGDGCMDESKFEGVTKINDHEFELHNAPRRGKEQIVYIKLNELHAFKNHPFEVRDDEEMRAMVSSVKDKGVTQPAIVRPREDGGYEIVSGHRRQKASELAGYADSFSRPCRRSSKTFRYSTAGRKKSIRS